MIEFPKMKYNAKSPSHSYLILLSRRKISPSAILALWQLYSPLSSFSIEASIVFKYFQVPYYWEGSQLNHFSIKSYLYHSYKILYGCCVYSKPSAVCLHNNWTCHLPYKLSFFTFPRGQIVNKTWVNKQ